MSAADVTRLRRQLAAEQVRVLAEYAELRERVRAKFPGLDLLATELGLQQATDAWTARYKASRIPAGVPVIDWCCGIGGDLMALAARGPAVGVDRDPVACLLAAANVREAQGGQGCDAWTVCDEVTGQMPTPGSWLHADPDRRPTGRRVSAAERASPPASVIEEAVQRAGGATIKLAPAAQLAEFEQARGEREWISFAGECRQQVYWLGEGFAGGVRRATVVFRDAPAASFASAECPPAGGGTEGPGKYLFDLDPAVRAAGLSTAFAERYRLQAVGGPAGFFTAESPLPSPLVQIFEVEEVVAADRRQLAAVLRRRRLRPTTLKVRGLSWDPPAMLRRLPREGAPCVLLAGRTAQGAYVAVAQPVSGTRS